MKDPLYGNKVAAAVLTTALLAIGLPITIGTVSNVLAGHHGHHGTADNPAGLAYIPTDVKWGGAGPAVEEKKVSLAELLANADATRGERAAGLCAACHTFGPGLDNGIGPNLWGVVGRDVASVSGFGYSAAAKSFEGEWTYENLDGYLRNSSSFMPGTSMAQMVRKDPKRADILAFLQTLSDSPVPFPEVVEVAVTEDAATEDGHDGEDH